MYLPEIDRKHPICLSTVLLIIEYCYGDDQGHGEQQDARAHINTRGSQQIKNSSLTWIYATLT